jgi:DNA helicase II / ATP-dependent DNA helicase PcrA
MALAEKADRTFVAGDDDQAVYTWSGADVESFLSCEGEVKILEQSYRVPAKVHFLANSIVKRIQNRQEKIWAPRQEQGEINYYNQFEQVDISKGEWLNNGIHELHA